MRRVYKTVIEIETNRDARWLEKSLRERYKDLSEDGGRITYVEVKDDWVEWQ